MVKVILGQHWEMPHPAEEERRRKDLVEVRTREIPVLSAELFLLLGQDGAEFKDMAAKFRVRLYVNHLPLAIRAEGLEPDLIDLTKYIDEFKLVMSIVTAMALSHLTKRHIRARISSVKRCKLMPTTSYLIISCNQYLDLLGP
ncbi:hypothetical protein BS47DRAFT_1344209 [Hydnum rufescens UP504]|uniref:Uncharacterized protein n=1 Tax=Hydnum rufescens UP504 TaxID=1448309 RepID=A0A9P6AWP9_9AGAM|nr:hypothetical protein BS47DRAFT_1344209 [Hydnum rufescens UP504]